MWKKTPVLGLAAMTMPSIGNVTLLQDNRQISSNSSLFIQLDPQDGGTWTENDYAELAPAFGTLFDDQVSTTLTGTFVDQSVTASSQATQNSSISSNTLYASLNVDVNAVGSAFGHSPNASASSIFDVTFTLTQEMSYTFDLLSISGMSTGPGTQEFARLINDQGNIIAGFFGVGSASGTLAAGQYRMVVEASIPFLEFGPGSSRSKSIEANLTFIPSPSSFALLGMAGVAASRRRRR